MNNIPLDTLEVRTSVFANEEERREYSDHLEKWCPDQNWFYENISRLIEKYRVGYLVIKNKRVLFHHNRMIKVKKYLKNQKYNHWWDCFIGCLDERCNYDGGGDCDL